MAFSLEMINYQQLEQVCEQHGIQRLMLFGSALRPDFRPESDIDLLVELDQKRRYSLFDLGGMQMQLTELFGRFVDLKTLDELHPQTRESILHQARVIYE
jgi:predicted nucleotidyltransferase